MSPPQKHSSLAAMSLDPFGRPIVHTEGDAALAEDTLQASLQNRQGWAASYGGRRQAGAAVRGGLLHNHFVKFGFPGAVLGFLLALFLFPPAGGAGKGATATVGDHRDDKKKKITWAGPAPPPGTEVKLMLVVREDLGMSVGKIAAQCSHAAVGIVGTMVRLRGRRLVSRPPLTHTRANRAHARGSCERGRSVGSPR